MGVVPSLLAVPLLLITHPACPRPSTGSLKKMQVNPYTGAVEFVNPFTGRPDDDSGSKKKKNKRGRR